MNRRTFLGSVIGTFLSTSFFAKLDTEEWQHVILPYRMLFKTNGHYIQAPGVKKIIQTTPTSCNWVAETLNVTHAMSVDSVVLLTEKGKVILEDKFNCAFNLSPGDSFFCTIVLKGNVPLIFLS